jgi:hypothetical protein
MRIQLELSDNSVAQIKALMQAAGIKTYSDLFSNALAVLNWAVKETRKGRKIVSADQDKNQAVTQLAMPVLDAVAPQPNDD